MPNPKSESDLVRMKKDFQKKTAGNSFLQYSSSSKKYFEVQPINESTTDTPNDRSDTQVFIQNVIIDEKTEERRTSDYGNETPHNNVKFESGSFIVHDNFATNQTIMENAIFINGQPMSIDSAIEYAKTMDDLRAKTGILQSIKSMLENTMGKTKQEIADIMQEFSVEDKESTKE